LQTGRTLDAVPLVPRLAHELRIIEQDKLIHLVDEVEETRPGKVAGL
jgi:hypothetical protein